MADEDPIIGDAPPRRNTLFSNTVYDRLKFVAQVVLPALALFYIALAPLWGFPKQEEVAGTIVALDLFLGSVLGISTARYKATVDPPAVYGGTVVFQDTGGKEPDVNLILKRDARSFEHLKEVRFKVERQ